MLGFWVLGFPEVTSGAPEFLALHFFLLKSSLSEDPTMSTPSQHYKERRNLTSFSTGTKLIAGGLAGVITKTSTAPLERYILFS